MNVNDILNDVGLSRNVNQFPAQLSGGEQQRVSIARAIYKNPKLLLCDEPTGALDSDTGVQILKLLQGICRNNKKTVIIVTHNQALEKAADKIIRVKNGLIKEVIVNDNPIKIEEVNW